MKTDNKNIDAGKAAALRAAGWRNERIAAEMGITPQAVEEVLRNHAEKAAREQRCEAVEETKPEKIVCLSAAELREIYEKAAVIGAKEALKTFGQERKKEYSHRADKRLRNTKLLLRNYVEGACRKICFWTDADERVGTGYSGIHDVHL